LGYNSYVHGNVTKKLFYSYLKQTKISFFFFNKIREQEIRTDPVWRGWFQWEGGGCGERVWEGEYGKISVDT
jgi:hypothetical protein